MNFVRINVVVSENIFCCCGAERISDLGDTNSFAGI